MCVWYRQSAANTSFAPLGQVDEWATKLSSFNVRRGCFQNILGLWLLKRWKIRTAYRQWRSNFLRRGENQNKKRKTESYVFSDFYTGISRGWEWKSTTGIFTTGRFWPWTWKISFVAEDKVGNWEFCVLKLGPLLFLYWFNAFFIFSLSANSLYNF